MSNVIHNNGNSLSLYRTGYRGWVRNSTLDVQTYYEGLCDAVVREYKAQGFCNLVDSIIEGKQAIEAISYFCLEEAGKILQGYNKSGHIKYAPVPINNPTYPFSKPNFYTWDEWTRYLQQSGSGMMYRYDERVNKTLKELKMKGQACHIEELSNNQKGEKNEMQTKATEEANREADQILIKAKEDSSKIIEEARIEAERIRTEACQDDKKNKRGGEADILSTKMIQEYLEKEREMVRITLDKEYGDALDESHAVLGTAERLHNEMCDQTNNLQASWVKALDKTVEELTAIKEDFYKRIHSWQIGLYPHELRPFAERYIELYRIVNVDKIIAEELFRINIGNNAERGEQKTGRSQSGSTGNVIPLEKSQKEDSVQINNSSPVLGELEKLNRKLITFLNKFESSLNGLDMYVYRPENGEVYDEVWHVVEDDSEFDSSKEYRVVRCILPGVAKKVNDDGEDDVIIPAIVEV